MGQVVSQVRGDSYGFPGLPNSKNFAQPRGESTPIWEADQTKRNVFGTTNNQFHFWFNYMVLNIPFLPNDCSLKKSALDRQVAVSLNINYKSLKNCGALKDRIFLKIYPYRYI